MNKKTSRKEHILLSGIEVMKRSGYNGCSIKDIVDAASVPKGSFYNYFDSKESFAVEALEHVAQENAAVLKAALNISGSMAYDRLINFFETGIMNACNAEYKVGCFLGNMCQEMSDSSEVVRSTVHKAMNLHADLIKEVIAEVIEDKGLQLDQNVTAEFLYNAWSGAIMRAKAAKSREPLEAFLTMTKRILT